MIYHRPSAITETRFLGLLALGSKGRVLDLCSGAGSQALLAAGRHLHDLADLVGMAYRADLDVHGAAGLMPDPCCLCHQAAAGPSSAVNWS